MNRFKPSARKARDKTRTLLPPESGFHSASCNATFWNIYDTDNRRNLLGLGKGSAEAPFRGECAHPCSLVRECESKIRTKIVRKENWKFWRSNQEKFADPVQKRPPAQARGSQNGPEGAETHSELDRNEREMGTEAKSMTY